MRNVVYILFAVLFYAALSGTGPAVAQAGFGNPAIRNPIGSPTVPQSSFRSGLFPSRNPIDTTGNRVITGNVGGGKHFRGVVPYNAISDFAGRTNSGTLDSFLRRSRSPISSGGVIPGRYNPYYSPSGTVTTTRPGLRSVIRSPSSRIQGRAVEGFSVAAVPRGQTFSSPQTIIPEVRYRPMRFRPQHLEKLILDGTLSYAEAKKLVDEQNLAQMERLRQDLGQLQHRAPSLRQSLIVRDDPLRPFSKFAQGADTLQRPELLKTKKQPAIDDTGLLPEKSVLREVQKRGQLDVYERMKQEIEKAQNEGLIPDTRDPKQISGVGGEEPTDDERQSETEMEKRLSLMREQLTGKSGKGKTLVDELAKINSTERAKSIMGKHQSFASYSDDKFNQHMRAAELYLKEGKYYRAANTYTLASIYKHDDPLAYAGKSHALFAAGGYMSSALFLSRTLEIFPEYARFKIDLVAMVGDRDKVESRIIDIEEWLQRSDSADLQFLLGYVYYQLGRANEAKKAIDAAFEKLPDAPAVITLKKAIDIGAAGNQVPE
ncbi:MAG: hypothetical protein FVQ85_01465 [Planctomycetes bacterium]|nr:hypothetical protein [Planctomycetota bacterium]